jgi:hypothetical protein
VHPSTRRSLGEAAQAVETSAIVDCAGPRARDHLSDQLNGGCPGERWAKDQEAITARRALADAVLDIAIEARRLRKGAPVRRRRLQPQRIEHPQSMAAHDQAL